MKEISPKSPKINVLAPKSGSKEISTKQQTLDLDIEKDTDVNGIGMGVLSDGTPYLNQRGLAAYAASKTLTLGPSAASGMSLIRSPALRRSRPF